MSSEFKYFCEKCNYGTNIRYSLIQHNNTALHKTGVIKKTKLKEKIHYTCDKCDYNTLNKNNFITHKLNNHSTKEERSKEFTYYCELCDFGVFTESSFDKHKDTIRHKRLNK
jgi:hypothetical protein